MEKNKCFIYKNDLKFNDDIDITLTEFDSDNTKNIYIEYKNTPKIELRIKDSEIENYEYLDLSNLGIDDELLVKLCQLKKINNILNKVKFLDLSFNSLKKNPNLSIYSNIVYLNISNNEIEGNIIDNNLVELTCENNRINRIESNSLLRLSGSNNKIEYLNTPKIKMLIVNNNKLVEISSYNNLEYLECINNRLNNVDNLENVEELYISDNNISNLNSYPKLLILNCTNNPINKIKYFEKLKMLLCSTASISSRYNITNISKVKQDYLINFSNK